VTSPAERTYDGFKRLFNLYRLTGRIQKLWVRFGREVDGQDLLEYTFLLAFILLASVAFMLNIAPGASAIWAQTGVTLDQAGGGPAAAGSRDLPVDANKKASPATAAFSTTDVVVAGATVAVLSGLLWYSETSLPAGPDQPPTPQPKQLTEAVALRRRRPTDSDESLAS
jgi:hypothetical protein